MIAYQLIRPFEDGRHAAFEEGARAAGYETRPYINDPMPQPGDVLMTWNLTNKEHIAQRFHDAGAAVMVAEEAYTRRLWPQPHFAVSLNGHNGAGVWFPKHSDSSRWRALGLEIAPWRLDGDHVLVCGQRGIGSKQMASPPNWHEDVAARLRRHTERPVIVRPHPGKKKDLAPPLAEQLEAAWAVVVWSSACAVQALLAGIPVFYEAPHHILGPALLRHIERVDFPALTHRLDAFQTMAWAQWSMEEIRAGEPFTHLLNR